MANPNNSEVDLVINEKEQTVTITMPLARLTPSKSGKTLRVCSTEGGCKPGVSYKGKPVTVNVNAYISAE